MKTLMPIDMSAVNGNTKPGALAPIIEAIPSALARTHQWVLWRWEQRSGRWTKPPYQVDGTPASSTDSATWTSLEDVMIVYGHGDFDGIGFVLDPSSLPLVAIDLDHVVDADGAIYPEALRILHGINSYTEISPSGRGLHILSFGTLPHGWRNARKALPFPIEVYSEGRYVTISGHRLAGSPETIGKRTGELAALHARVAAAMGDKGQAGSALAKAPRTLADAAVLEHGRQAQNGSKFDALWRGDASAYESHSEADLALCGMLAFWTARDAAQIDRLFRQSALMRPKWDRRSGAQTYGERTIAAAIEHCIEVYAAGSIARAETAAPTTSADDRVAGPDDGGLAPVKLGDLLDEPGEEQRYVVADRLSSAALGILAGKPKAGKSTLARCLALRVSRGEEWLGHTTNAGPVIYLALEEKRAEVTAHFRALGATSADRVLILCASAPLDALARLRRETERIGPVLIIVDPLFRLIRVPDGNDYATMSAALEPLMVLARETGAHVLLVHHLGKGERAGGDAILGSTAIFGAVDTALLLRRSEKYRTLASLQRYGADLEEITVTLDPITRNV